MAERTTDKDGAAPQGGTRDKDQEAPAQDAAQAGAQQEYLAGLRSPADRARSAIRDAGLPIDHLIPDNAKAFEKKKDGTFTLQLAGEKKIKIDNVTLVMTQNISGKLGSGTMENVKGIYGIKKVMFFSGRGNILRMFLRGSKFVVNTDHDSAKEIVFEIADIKDVS